MFAQIWREARRRRDGRNYSSSTANAMLHLIINNADKPNNDRRGLLEWEATPDAIGRA